MCYPFNNYLDTYINRTQLLRYCHKVARKNDIRDNFETLFIYKHDYSTHDYCCLLPSRYLLSVAPPHLADWTDLWWLAAKKNKL